MLHLRIIVPQESAAPVDELLRGHAGVINIVSLPGAATSPAGDVFYCDVVREGASVLIDELRKLGVERDGCIMVERVDTVLSAAADRAEERVPGLGVDAVVWEEIERTTGEETELSGAFLTFLTVATVIAAIGVLLDQPILIVGAMVVGPEFGPLAALCVGIVQRRAMLVRRALVTLGVGFPVAMLVTVVAVWLFDAAGLVSEADLLRERPLTEFIWQPDALSWVVGFLAGVAGMLSLTSAKSGTLVGVLISVTTVPAAANAAVAVAYWERAEAAGSALQFLINVAAIVIAGVLSLLVQRFAGRGTRRWLRAWRRKDHIEA